MNILLIQDILRSGGTERQTILLAQGFAAAGHASEVVTFRPGGTLASSLSPVRHSSLQTFDTTLNWFAPGLLRTARSASPDVVLCMGRMANCHSGRLQRALPRTSVVGTMRTGKALPWLFRRSLHTNAHVVANSGESAEVLTRDYKLPPSRVSVIHNALVFPASAGTVRETELRTRHGAGPQTRVLLCVGMFRPEKNQRALVEIAASLERETDWQLWFAGEGPERSACEALTLKLGIGDRVKFLGFQSDPTPLYRAADIAVLTSTSESLSNFLIEAQAHGLPAVAYAAAGVSECLRNGITGEVIPMNDREAFIFALRRYLNHSAVRTQASLAARLFAREAFDPARQTQAYLDLFARLNHAKAP
jgi:glycosyltransferase involved in cell wall biosynthesis